MRRTHERLSWPRWSPKRGWLVLALGVLGSIALVASAPTARGEQPYQGPNAAAQEGSSLAVIDGRVRTIPIVSQVGPLPTEEQGVSAPPSAPAPAPAVAPRATIGCSDRAGDNVRINSDCGFRPQNETAIAVNPTDHGNLIAGSNDYRVGDGFCPYFFSFDGAQRWGDGKLPMLPVITNDPSYHGDLPSITQQKRKYFQAGGDPSVTFDATGVAYSICGLFDRTTPDNALFVARSFSGGAYYQRHGQDTRQQPAGVGGINGNGPVPVQEHYNDPLVFSDKQYMTADQNPQSPFANTLYVTWTEFKYTRDPQGRLRYRSSEIYFSRSTNQGVSFERPRAISGANPALCRAADPTLGAGACDSNQFSEPFVGPDGALYVTWANYNNPLPPGSPDNRNQILIVKSTDGGVSFTPPRKVADYYDLPECAPGDGSPGAVLNRGRACVGTDNINGGTDRSHFRAANYPSGIVDPTDPGVVYVHVGSYINELSNETDSGCTPAGISPSGQNLFAGRCRNHIVQSVSTDGGLSFEGTDTDPRELSVVSGGGEAHQWWQWTAAAPNGRIDVSFYDRSDGDCQVSGCQDITLASAGAAARAPRARPSRSAAATPRGQGAAGFALRHVTSGSMPPPTQFGGLFFGDYMGLASTNAAAYPLWADTRRPDTQRDDTAQPGTPSGVPLNDQDAVVAAVEPAPGP